MPTKLAASAACILTTLPCFANATEVQLYGLVDTSIRFSTNENASGNSKVQMTDGALTGSRWGLRGTENLGGNVKAWLILESGFAPDAGTSLQGGRLFGRTSVVGLDGDFGKLAVGRQYTLAHEIIGSYDAMGIPNNSIVGYQAAYSGLRYDNTIKYIKSFGGLQVAAAYTFGETPGKISTNNAAGGSIAYSSGPFELGAVYQVTHNVSSTFFGLPATQASKQTVWAAGGTYKIGRAQYYLGYTNNRLDVADYKNDAAYAGVKYQFTDSLTLIGQFYHDWLEHAGSGGKRLTTAAMLDYNFSKRTDAYVEVDYTNLKGGWIALNGMPAFSNSGNTFGNSTRLGMMVGLRHKF
ncbi:porin [Cupriavidus pinatubonensis]|uniref:porin n=1 Tax=Cupriavidus pinatubonensis TaxID=248026 RepID=UPI00112CF4B5|nr:porin [Cupriavidus pinatubonensis]TPQ39768.1 porin [Cupriavidus pinatubonensis]